MLEKIIPSRKIPGTRDISYEEGVLAVDRSSDEFITLLTQAQPIMFACIYALLPDRMAAQDILQETNLTLCRKAEDFEPGTNFKAWATRIARYHVLNYRRKLNRERLVFDDSLFEELCARQAARTEELCLYTEAMRKCLGNLPATHQELLTQRYAPGGSVAELAKSLGKSVGAISQRLYRLRQSLMDCVYQRLQEGRA
jgi:RNA polymerase sigma-70 factor (ECF subfamily)